MRQTNSASIKKIKFAAFWTMIGIRIYFFKKLYFIFPNLWFQ